MRRNKSGISGFTLVELVITILILGVLVAIAVPNYTRTQERARTQSAIVALKLIRSAQEIYRGEYGGVYPSGGASQSTINAINTNLRLDLNEAEWDYSVTGYTSSFIARADRVSGRYSSCIYQVNQGTFDPSPVNPADCP